MIRQMIVKNTLKLGKNLNILIMKEKDVVFKCCTAGGPVGSFSAKFINAKDIIEIIPTKIAGEAELMIIYYDHELLSECSFFCNSIETNLKKY